MDKPFLMNKQNFLYVPNTPVARKVLCDSAIEITLEQAKALDADRNAAGYEIMRVIVAEDNRRALAEAQARLAEATGQRAPAPVEAAPAQAPAETEPDRPWSAKTIKGNPPKKDLIAFLEGKVVADAAELPYDELKVTAATYDWVAEHGEK
jgi:hypothetical protein